MRGIDTELGKEYQGKVVSRSQLQLQQDSLLEHDGIDENDLDDDDDDDLQDFCLQNGDNQDDDEEEDEYEQDSDVNVNENQDYSFDSDGYDDNDNDNGNDNDNENGNQNDGGMLSDDEFDTTYDDKDMKSAGYDAYSMPVGDKYTKKAKYLQSNYVQQDDEDGEDEDDDNDIDNENENRNDFMLNKTKIQTFATPQRKSQERLDYDNHQIRKAKAVALQCKFYDKVASLRIHMQTVEFLLWILVFFSFLVCVLCARILFGDCVLIILARNTINDHSKLNLTTFFCVCVLIVF